MSGEARILDLIDSPADLKKLDIGELEILASEIREEIITVTSKTGGHVSASLGAVEIILAAHSLLDCPNDKIVFDVGHQAYAHKLLTGRRDKFKDIRKYGKMSGFPKPDESDCDVHYSGHASDSLSIALGLARAKKACGSNEKIVAIIGDASIAGGMAVEALNQIGQEKLPIVIILNENNMAISPTVGGMRAHLSAARFSSRYKDARDIVFNALQSMGTAGKFAIKWGAASKNSVKHFLSPHHILFEEFGVSCTPIVDGHNIKMLQSALKKALASPDPVLIHAVTTKGAGYEPAQDDPETFHGIGPYDIETGQPCKVRGYSFTNAFSDAVIIEAEENKQVFALTAAMTGGTGLKAFAKQFPDRFIDVGIAEQHLVGVAAGLASGGYKPVVACYSTFLQRAIDQIIVNSALPNLDIVFAIDRAGLVGPDGVTHHGIFDMAYCSMVPHMTVIAPSCAFELKSALHTALKTGGPFAIRYPRGSALEILPDGSIDPNVSHEQPEIFKQKSSRILKKGDDLSILAFGDSVLDALSAAEKLKSEGVDARVVDMRYVKPLDAEVIRDAAVQTHRIITVENGILRGGAGDGVLVKLNQMELSSCVKIINLGINDQFINHGSIEQLKADCKIDSNAIYAAGKRLVTNTSLEKQSLM